MTKAVICYAMPITDADKRAYQARYDQAEALVGMGFRIVAPLRRLFSRRPKNVLRAPGAGRAD